MYAYNKSNSEPVVLASINLPICGKTKETDNIPAPPINDKPKAPLSGIFSETKEA